MERDIFENEMNTFNSEGSDIELSEPIIEEKSGEYY